MQTRGSTPCTRRHTGVCMRAGEHESHGRALAGRAVDLELRAVPLDHAVHHGEPEPGAALALGREERLEAAAPRLVVHADAGVGDFDVTRSRAALARREPGADAACAA